MGKKFAFPRWSSPPTEAAEHPPPPLDQTYSNAESPWPPSSSSTSSAIPFTSFDIGNASASSSTIYFGNIHSLSSATSFDEEPLLDELGIHPEQIWCKTRSILNPFRVNTAAHHHNSDLSGPIPFYLSFCLFQHLSGNDVVLGWIVVCSIFIYVVFNMLAGKNDRLDLHTCTSDIGYCMLPILVLSALSLFMPQGSLVRFVVAGVSKASTTLMDALAEGEEGGGTPGPVVYSCFLILLGSRT